MRILYFSQDYGPHDHRFLSALAESEHEVFYLRLERNRRQVEDRPVPSKVEQVLWAGGRGEFRWGDVPRLVLDLKRLIRHLRPDLIHAGPIQTCAFLAVLSGFRPVLSMSWGFDLMQDAERNAWWRAVTRYTLARSTFFVSDAQVTRERAIGYGMNPERTVVFPWGIDLQRFNVSTLHSTQGGPFKRANDEGFTLFCNRSWESRYGVDVLARAFVRVAQQREDAGLLLLGGGSQAQVIRQILLNGGALDRVQFGGQVSQNDLPHWYRLADLYVSPSHVDGSSVSLMEALACGLPALVSDIPANREWVTEGVNGWLFPDGDDQALAARILAIAAKPQALPEIGRAARRSAEQRADWKRNFAKLLDAYEQTMRLK
jgi:glycosyltransferase involved in cell wall biosynthesis